MNRDKVIRIGGAAAFYGDTSISAPQLIHGGNIDYLIFDYLAEVTLMIFTRVKAKYPQLGYARDFVDVVMRENIRDIAARGIKVITNAGGVNPRACRDSLLSLANEMGIDLKVAIVEGDDLMPRHTELSEWGITDMYSGEPWPDNMMSINAYLGVQPIVESLAMGADIVLTGRIPDSALTLGPLIHEFGWSYQDYDLLAQGSLAGHIIECGAQATGGLHTDWELVPDWEHIGYPIAECHADGSFIITKPPETGGLVTPATVGEQLLYEIGDPQAYILPDVVCDFTGVKIEQVGKERVRVTGTVGRPPTDTYKVSAGFHDGYRCIAMLPVIGIDAALKAERQAKAIIERTRNMLRQRDFTDYRAVWIELLGAEASYGANSRSRKTREVACKIAVEHDEREPLDIFAREVYAPVTSMSPGTTGWYGGRPSVSAVVRLFSFLIPKTELSITVTVDGETRPVIIVTEGGFDYTTLPRIAILEDEPFAGETVTVPLIKLAWGRSGDKGNNCNIGIIARKPQYLPYIRAALTTDSVMSYMAHTFEGAKNPRVERFELPGFNAINLLLHESLGGGGMASLRLDVLAKGMAQQLLDFPIPVPAELARKEEIEITPEF
jgi:hypothetical protein